MAKTQTGKRNVLTADEFVSMVIRKRAPDAVKLGLEKHFFDLMTGHGFTDEKEERFLRKRQQVPLALMAKILLLAFDVLPYPIASDCPINKWRSYGTKKVPYQWCWNTAVYIGLVDETADPDDIATKSQAKKAIRILEKHEYDHIPEGDFPGKDILPEKTCAYEWIWRNAILLGSTQVSDVNLKRFKSRGWTISYSVYQGLFSHEDYGYYVVNEYFSIKCDGVCDKQKKVLHITSSDPSIIVLGIKQALYGRKRLSEKVALVN